MEVVKALQVEDHVCVTGGSDHKLRLWDLRKVGEEDGVGDRPKYVHREDALSSGEIPLSNRLVRGTRYLECSEVYSS